MRSQRLDIDQDCHILLEISGVTSFFAVKGDNVIHQVIGVNVPLIAFAETCSRTEKNNSDLL